MPDNNYDFSNSLSARPKPRGPFSVSHTLSNMHTIKHTHFLLGACKITPTVQSPVGARPQGLEDVEADFRIPAPPPPSPILHAGSPR